jgi:hypothetical protein
MPPMYPYRCDRSGVSIDVQRDVDDRDTPPTSDEIAAANIAEPTEGFAWRRYILPPKVAFGESWSYDGRGMKGRH